MTSPGKGFLYDTSTVSALFNPKHNAHTVTTTATDGLPGTATKWISAITIGELWFGVQRAEFKLKATATEARQRVNLALARPLLPVSDHVSETYGEMKGTLAKNAHDLKGNAIKHVEEWIDATDMKPFGINDNDLWIAASAVAHDLTLVSNDGDFTRLKAVYPSLELITILPPAGT